MGSLLAFLRRYLLALLGSAWILTAGMLDRRHRGFLGRILRQLGWSPTWPGEALPRITLAELVGDASHALIEPQGADGNVTMEELFALAHLAAAADPPGIFEIGTFDGRTTLNLALASPPGAVVHTLDLPPATAPASTGTAMATERADRVLIGQGEPGRRFLALDPAKHPYVARIRRHFGDSAAFDPGPLAGSIGLVFVDGAHSYEYVRSDTRKALALLPPDRGVIAWHDYGEWPGVTRALNELAALNPDAGLVQLAGTKLVLYRRRAGSAPLRLWA